MLKRTVLLIVLFLSFSTSVFSATSKSCDQVWDYILRVYSLDPLYKSLVGLCGSEFRKKLLDKMATNKDLGYDESRRIMFSELDNTQGYVCGVYSGECIKTKGIPDHRIFNTEHSWCQSWGATGKAKADLHHLYPVKSNLNSKRNNFPFCEVQESSWEDYGSYFGVSYSGTTCFEPRDEHKGALARAMFYFSVRYSRPIDKEQETFFRKWNYENSVSEKEHYRNEGIFHFQGNRNPFVQYPEFVDLIADF